MVLSVYSKCDFYMQEENCQTAPSYKLRQTWKKKWATVNMYLSRIHEMN